MKKNKREIIRFLALMGCILSLTGMIYQLISMKIDKYHPHYKVGDCILDRYEDNDYARLVLIKEVKFKKYKTEWISLDYNALIKELENPTHPYIEKFPKGNVYKMSYRLQGGLIAGAKHAALTVYIKESESFRIFNPKYVTANYGRQPFCFALFERIKKVRGIYKGK